MIKAVVQNPCSRKRKRKKSVKKNPAIKQRKVKSAAYASQLQAEKKGYKKHIHSIITTIQYEGKAVVIFDRYDIDWLQRLI